MSNRIELISNADGVGGLPNSYVVLINSKVFGKAYAENPTSTIRRWVMRNRDRVNIDGDVRQVDTPLVAAPTFEVLKVRIAAFLSNAVIETA